MRSVMRTLLNSDFFKDESVRYAKVKSPVEVVVGTLRLVEDYITPKPGIDALVVQAGYMGQMILNPPSVEGWHAGKEWINSGSLSSRVNFVAERVGDTALPGVQTIINRLASESRMSAPDFVDGCLELVGPLTIGEAARAALIAHVEQGGELSRDTEEQRSRLRPPHRQGAPAHRSYQGVPVRLTPIGGRQWPTPSQKTPFSS